jgi:hypothetical protein
MANSTRAHDPSPESPEAASAAPHAAPNSAPSPNDTESLVLQADDDIENIRHVHCASACLEKLILPQRVNDTEEMHPTRSELGALMRLVNEELHRRIDAADATIRSLRSATQATSRQTLVDRDPDPSVGYGWTANGPVRVARG